MNIGELRQLQSMPLEYKIRKSQRIIHEAYEMFEGNLYRSIAGNDSNVMDHLIDSCGYLDIPRVSVSMAEPKGNNTLNAEKGTIFVSPKMSKKQIIRKYGYPVIYKNLSMAVSRYQRTKFQEQRDYRLNGRINPTTGKKESAGTIPKKYHELIYIPFLVTEKCCIQIKESPLKSWSVKNGNAIPITGELADESNNRLKEYLKHGCIMFDKKAQKVTPLGFWTDQDVKEYYVRYDLKYSEDYGELVRDDSGLLMYTGEPRTGCDICTFGILHDPERFKRMRKNKPLRYSGMMNGGEFVHSGIFREVKFTPGAPIEWSDLAWMPNKQGYGYRYVLNYLNELYNLGIYVD